MKNRTTLTAAPGALTRVGLLGAALALAACGQNQNWQSVSGFVTIGGTVSGLSGTLVLQNNSRDDLSISANGSFVFALSIERGKPYAAKVSRQPSGQVCTVTAGSGTASADVNSIAVVCASNVTIGGTISGLTGTLVLQNNSGNSLAAVADGPFTFTESIPPGAPYDVTVQTQPAGQTCTVANGAGTASANVTNVAVACAAAGAFALRPLPAIYTTGKAINYSPYRAAGPGSEVPTDAQLKEDFGLLEQAGFNLLRLFGSDVVSENILRVAAANYPDLKFQLGVYIFGIPPGASCGSNTTNSDQITTGIRLARQYTNVVAVSVGNETSFFRTFMPVNCLLGFVQTVRNQVPQPVTADDDYTFYVTAASDPILAATDFVSLHTYPISNDTRWDPQQSATPAGPQRAAAMMNAAFAQAKDSYDQVANHLYRDAGGSTVTVQASRAIVVGETGWKAVQTNPARAIETYTANPVNQKWYYDLMVSWEQAVGGPTRIFIFEGFDETWKGIDDGWGLWDSARTPRYALCGTPAGSPCNADIYQGAGFYP